MYVVNVKQVSSTVDFYGTMCVLLIYARQRFPRLVLQVVNAQHGNLVYAPVLNKFRVREEKVHLKFHSITFL